MPSLLAELPCDDALIETIAIELLPDAGPARPRTLPQRQLPHEQPRHRDLLRTPRWMW